MSQKTDVLVIEDDEDIRDALSDALSDAGYSVSTASDGFDALEWLRNNPAPCVILLDWMMPHCDGVQFRNAQINDPSLKAVPVVLLTADANVESKRAQMSADEFLRKPVQLRQLLDVVARFCQSA
jgi:CheY-like chemotaxis protein